MADDVLSFLNQPIPEKKAPEDPVLSFLNRPVAGAEPPAPAAQAPAWVAKPPITLDQVGKAIGEAGSVGHEAFAPAAPESPVEAPPSPKLVAPPAPPAVEAADEATPPEAQAPTPPPVTESATGEGAGGGGGGGWGADRKEAAEPLVPERTGILGVVDKGTELAAKGLAEAAVPAAEAVGAVHGFYPELSKEDQEKVKTDVGQSLLTFGRGWIKGRSFGLYQPPELTPEQKQLGADWAETVGDFVGIGGAIKSIASNVPSGLKVLGILPQGVKGFVGEAGVTGLLYSLFDYAGRNLGTGMAGTQTEPGFGTGMIASGLEYGAAQLGQPEVAKAIHEGAKKLGPAAMALDFMTFALGGTATVNLLGKMFDARARGLAESQTQTLRNDLTTAYWKDKAIDPSTGESAALATTPPPVSDAELGQWFQSLTPVDRTAIVMNSQTGKNMTAWIRSQGYRPKPVAESPIEQAPPKGPPPPEESVNLTPEVKTPVETPPEATTAAPVTPIETPGSTTSPPVAEATPTPQAPPTPMGNTGVEVTERGAVPPVPKAPVASVQPPDVYQEESGWWKVKGTDNQFSTQAAAQKAADIIQKNGPVPDESTTITMQPMGATGDTTAEASVKPDAPAAPVEAAPDWQDNPSVQHFQAQGFEFVEAKTPEETADLQARGFEQAGVAPDLWFKRPEPVESPTPTPAPTEIVQPAASGEVAPEVKTPIESPAPTSPLPPAFTGKRTGPTPATAMRRPSPSEPPAPEPAKDLWYENTAFPAGTYTKESAAGPATLQGHKIGDYIIFDATQWSGERGWMVMRTTDGRSMTGTRALKKQKDALGYAKDLHEGDLEERATEKALTVTQPAWQLSKQTAMDSWYGDRADGTEAFSNTYYDGEPEDVDAILSQEPEGYKVVRGARREDSRPIKNPDTGDIFFKTADEAKAEYHRQEVMRARAAGEKVPGKVLAEYPETKQADLFSAKEPQSLPGAIAPKGKVQKVAVYWQYPTGEQSVVTVPKKLLQKTLTAMKTQGATVLGTGEPSAPGQPDFKTFDEAVAAGKATPLPAKEKPLPAAIAGKKPVKDLGPSPKPLSEEDLQAAEKRVKAKESVARAKPVAKHPGLPAGIAPKAPAPPAQANVELYDALRDKIDARAKSRDWSNLPADFETNAVRDFYEREIKGHLKDVVGARVKASKATTFVELQEAVDLAQKEFSKKVQAKAEAPPEAAPVDKSENAPIISTTEATPPEGGKGNENATVRPGKTPEVDQAGSGGQGPSNVPPVRAGGKTPKVRKGSRPSDDASVQSGGSGDSSSQGPGRPQSGSGSEPGAPPVHGGSPGDVAGVQRPPDYRITPGEIKRPGGWKATAEQNINIIELVKKLEAEGRWATPEEQALLVQYTGFGAGEIRNNIFPRGAYSHKTGKIDLYRVKDEWKPLAVKLMDLTTPEELAEIAQSTQYAHYTSETIIRSIYKAVERMGFPGGKILEPGSGTSLFGMLIPETMASTSRYTAIERDSITSLVAKHLLPNQNVLRADFIKKKLPDNFFDMGIGNPPFSQTVIEGDPQYSKLRFSLHDFFFAKGIDKIRPGGLQIFITSRYTMDKANDKARKYLADRADFIGAIRLPQTAFKANAGTEVVTDVLFFRKRAEGEAPGGVPWTEQGEVEIPWEEKVKRWDYETRTNIEETIPHTEKVLINEYFLAHPEMVLGANSLEGSMYSDREYTVLPKEGNIEDHFAAAVEQLPKNIYSIVNRPPAEQQKIIVERDFNPKIQKEGGLYIDDKGNLMVVEQGVGVFIDDLPALKTLAKPDKAWLRDYVPLRDALKQTKYEQHLDKADWEISHKALIKAYDAFVKKHGKILEYSTFKLAVKENKVPVIDEEGNPVTREYRRYKNARRFRADVESPMIYALEKITETGEIIKGPALLGRIATPPKRIEPKTSFEALAVTLDEVGKLDLDLIASKLNITRAEAIESLGDLIYKPPGGDWQTSDEYLSGDVVTKLEEAQAAGKADSQYQRNIEALELVQPVPLTPAQVTIGLGSSWIAPDYISQFAQEVLETPLPISYNAQIHVFTVGATGRSARAQTTQWGTSDRSAAEILDCVLNNKSMVIKRTEKDAFGKKHTSTDEPATTRVNEIAKNMREAFATWVWTDTHRADDLLEIYNRKYNNLAGRKFDGEHLTLPGLSINFPLHKHQKRAIWRIVVAGNTYLNHAVGAGKTLEMICSGQEMKRMGLIKKPLHVVPKHMLEQTASDFMEAYPMANIMVADEENFHTDNRKRFMAQAALNNPDAIIITHSALGKLGMKPENVNVVRDLFIRDLEDLLADLEDDPQANRILIAKTERRIEKMNQRFDGMTNSNTDQAIFFEDLGADCIIVDESHKFRKLDFVTNRQDKGIDSNGSRMALDLYVKTQYLSTLTPGRSHIFGTGTPIVNTMGELYTIMRFFDDGQMEADGIHYFDAWANMFGQMVSDWEKTGAGNWEEVSRFASFVNVPELMKRVRQFTDVLTPRQLGAAVDLPSIKGGKAELMLAPESPAMKDYQENVLQPRLEQSRKWKPSPGEKGNPDPVINIITDGRLASIDMRYHYPDRPSDPGSKLNILIDDVIVLHHRTADYPYIDKETGQEEPIKGAAQIVFYKLGFGKGITRRRGFDARAWVMERFKEGGIPASQVAWIDDYPTSTAKGQLSKEVRQGVKRILLGSYDKMGTGLNVQNRLFVSHLLDPPWFPADLEQAEGRAIRQGNQNPQVIMRRWATVGSYDSTMFQMVARKARVFEQAWSGDDSVRTMEDVSAVSQYQMAAAYSSGDDRVIKLAQANGEVTRLHRLREAHFAEQRELRNKESSLSFWIPRDKEEIAKYRKAEKVVGGYVRDVTATIGDQTFTPDDKRSDIGIALMQSINEQIASREGEVPKALTEEDKRMNRLRIPEVTKVIGKLNDFDLAVATRNRGDEIVATLNIYVTKDLKPWVHEGKAFDPVDSHGGSGLISRVINQLNNIGRDADKLQQKLVEKETELRAVNKRLGIPFPDEQDLITKEEEVRRLQADLAATGTAAPGPDALADMVAALNAEKTATTMRTGPTYATAMRQPLVAGARNRIKETGYGTTATGKVEGEGRDGYLPEDVERLKREVADFKSRRRKGIFGGERRYAKLEFSEELAASPEFKEVAERGKARGLKAVLPVKGNLWFDGHFYPEKDGMVALLNEDLSPDTTHAQIMDHEDFHHLIEKKDAGALALLKSVDTKSAPFKAYRETLNALRTSRGHGRLSDGDVAHELAADFRAGLTYEDINGNPIHLAGAFKVPGTLPAYMTGKPAGGAAEARASRFAFKDRMAQRGPKVPITPKEDKAIDKWLGQKEVADFDAKVLAGNRQKAIMEALGKKKFDAECKAIDNAMTHYIELKSFPDHVAHYYQDLKPEDQKAVDLAQHVIPQNPKLKTIADEIAAGYKAEGQEALEAEVIHDLRDNYAAHIWDLDKKPSTESQRKFGPKTGHAQRRTFDTEIQGLAADYTPLVRGATNKAMIYSQDVRHTIADRQFIEKEMGKTLSTKQSDERPNQIQHSNMRGWKWAGSIEVEPIIAEVQRMSEAIKNSTKTSSTTTGPGTSGAPESGPIKAMKEVVRNSLIIRGMTEDEANAYINRIETAAVKASTGERATPGQAPPEKTTTVIQELRETIVKIEKSQEVVGHTVKPVGRKDLFVNANGDIFQRVPLFASEGAAGKLNNILGTSALKGIPFLSKAIDVATRIKETILFMTGYHHQAGVRGWLLGVTGQGKKGLSPRQTYRQGLKLISEMDPVIRHGVETGGLVLGMTPEWRESLNHEKGKIGGMLDKWKVTAAIRGKVLGLYDQQVNFLFGKLFPGLQAMAYITEYRNFMKKFPGTDPDEAARKVAEICNYNFGNLNYARMGRNPTSQHILRAVFLAPQWTESNYGPVRELVGALLKGDKEKAYIYRKFWASVFAKGIAALLLGNLAMSMFDDKSAWESFKERWHAGRLRFLGLNITPLYRGAYKVLGMEPSKSQKVFSPMGHFLDVIKMVSHPLLFLQHKGSPLTRFLYEAFAGVNWKGQPYTTAGEFTGATAGGALQGKIVKEGKGGGAISWEQMPSFLLGQLRGSVPIPAGNMMAMLFGEMDGFDALTKSTGTMVSSFTPKTEAQGIISDYYQAALPNRNLTPEERDRKDLEKKLLKQARDGDMEGFTDALTDAVADGKLSTTAAKDLMKEARHPEGVASFTKLPLEVALRAFEAATDEEKEIWGPALLTKIARSRSETLMHNQDSLQDILRGLGMDDTADALDEIGTPAFNPTAPASDEYQPLSGLNPNEVDSYLANKITGQAKKNKDTGPVKRAIHPSKSGNGQKKLKRLGLG